VLASMSISLWGRGSGSSSSSSSPNLHSRIPNGRTHTTIHSHSPGFRASSPFSFFLFLPHWVAVSHAAPIIMTSIAKPVRRMGPQARLTYLGIFAIVRRQDLGSPIHRSQKRHSSSGTYHRSDFTNQSYTGIYDAGAPTEVSASRNRVQLEAWS
jgi:hypothetical protein